MNRFNLLFCLSTYLIVGTETALDPEGIIGGDEDFSNEYSYQISLQQSNYHICGGSIIGDQHILTAAHCVIEENSNDFTSCPTRVVAGVIDLAENELDAVVVDVEKAYIRDNYFDDDTNDIAVLKLKQPLGLSSNARLRKLELPDANRQYAGLNATVTGYGSTWVKAHRDKLTGKLMYDTGTNTYTKKFAVAVVLNTSRCAHDYPRFFVSESDYENRLCARVQQRYYNTYEGVCHGDSGGPLVYNNKVVIGVVSSGTTSCNEESRPTFYTRVSSHLDFIRNAMVDRVTDDMLVHTYEKLDPLNLILCLLRF